MNRAWGTPWTSPAADSPAFPRASAISRLLVAPSISASKARSLSSSASGRITAARSRALVTSRMVRGKATRTSASPFIAPSSETATQGVYILPGLEHPRDAAFDHRLHRRLAVEDRPAIIPHGPAIGPGVREAQVKHLDPAHQPRSLGYRLDERRVVNKEG